MRHILIEFCGECPYFSEGETSSAGERWTADSCLKLQDIQPYTRAKIHDRTKILKDCPLHYVCGGDNYADAYDESVDYDRRKE
jgi:hypothetical protein